MDGEYGTFFIIALFIGLVFVVMIPLDGADILIEGDFNVTQDQLSFEPDVPNPQPETIDLQADNVEAINVTFVDISTISNPEFTGLESTTAATLENGTSGGILRFNFPDDEVMRTWHSRYGFFDLGQDNQVELEDSSSTFFLNGRQKFDISNDNLITFHLDDDGKYLYQVQVQEEANPGLFTTGIALVSEAISWIIRLFEIIFQLPLLVRLTLGTAVLAVLALLLIKIVSSA